MTEQTPDSTDERLREEQTTTDERLREEQTTTDERLREEQTTAAPAASVPLPFERVGPQPARGVPSGRRYSDSWR